MDLLQGLKPNSDGNLLLQGRLLIQILLGGAAAYFVTTILYSLTLHPLASLPGPRRCAASRIPWWIANITGNQVRFMVALHKRYGPVVRFGPNDVSYADGGQAWRDIYGHDKTRAENPKHEIFHAPPANGVYNLVSATAEDHKRVRKVFTPAFSERALRQQEPLFRQYVDLLVAKLGEGDGGLDEAPPKDLSKMFNLTTFDLMADLTFGQPLGLLENATYTEWVDSIFKSLKILPVVQMIEYYPFLKTFYNLIEPQSVKDLRHKHWLHSSSRVDARLTNGSDQPDILNLAMSAEVDGARTVSLLEMQSNAELFMTAGTETTASLLSGVCYYLMVNPDKMKLLAEELRGTYATNEDINIESLASLKYLNACLQEALRVYPPVPSTVPRRIAPGGNRVLGQWLPGGTVVSVHHMASYHSPANFREPDVFSPERWLPGAAAEARFAGENRDAFQPFSTGPRNCLGINFAWHEMRLILGKVVYNFDLELCSEAGAPKWTDQEVYVVWARKPLMCRLKRVRRDS